MSADQVLVDDCVGGDQGLSEGPVVEAVEGAASASPSSASVAAASSSAAAPTPVSATVTVVACLMRAVQVGVVVSSATVWRLISVVVVVGVHLGMGGVCFFLCERVKVVTLTIKTKNIRKNL